MGSAPSLVSWIEMIQASRTRPRVRRVRSALWTGLRIAERIPEDVRIAASLDLGQGNMISIPGLGAGVYEVRITDADGEILVSREVRTSAGLTSLRFE